MPEELKWKMVEKMIDMMADNIDWLEIVKELNKELDKYNSNQK